METLHTFPFNIGLWWWGWFIRKVFPVWSVYKVDVGGIIPGRKQGVVLDCFPTIFAWGKYTSLGVGGNVNWPGVICGVVGYWSCEKNYNSVYGLYLHQNCICKP